MLALICGTGDLPAKIAAAQNEPPLVCVLEGFEPTGRTADLHFSLETFGSLLIKLGQDGVTEACGCSAIDRQQIDRSRLDENMLPLVPLLAGVLQAGDEKANIRERDISHNGMLQRGDLLVGLVILNRKQTQRDTAQDIKYTCTRAYSEDA